jgi:hypothetical protein
MEDKNDAGFTFGERYNATAWSAWRMSDWLSLSLRVMYEKEGNINGHYNGPHQHSSPRDLQANYGGEFLDYGLGLNMVAQRGPFAGIRLGLEWVGNLNGNYNGYQLGRSDGLMMTLGKAF